MEKFLILILQLNLDTGFLQSIIYHARKQKGFSVVAVWKSFLGLNMWENGEEEEGRKLLVESLAEDV
ncbi:MAG: hypothetical protein ACLSG9_05235 [Eubacterium sp.]